MNACVPNGASYIDRLHSSDGTVCLYNINHQLGLDSGEMVHRTYVQLQECSKKYVSVLYVSIGELEAMLKPIEEFRTKTNWGQTAGTVTGVISTAMTVTGVVLAPATFGGSLALTIAGAATGAAAGVTTAGVAITDYYKSKDFVKGIESTLKKIENPAKELAEILEKIRSRVAEMVKIGYTEEDAMKEILIGVMKGTVDCGRITQNAGSIAMAAANMPVAMATAETASRSFQMSGLKLASGQLATNMATKKTVRVMTASTGGTALQSTSVLMGLTVGIGFALSVVDIILLVQAWSKQHLVAKTIEKLINSIKEEINKWEMFSADLKIYLTDRKVEKLHQCIRYIVEHYARREQELLQELEDFKIQSRQELEERERRMKEEFEMKQEEMKRTMENRQRILEERLEKLEAFMKEIEK